MSNQKIITVVGATGAQGGGLVRAILNDPGSEFSVRAITRNAGSDKAKAFAELGANVVEANVADKDSLVKAFEGSYGIFCVTFYWEHYSPEKEMQHAKNMAEAASEVGAKHVIWSTLEDTRKWIPLDDDRMPTLMEKYKVPHFDGKGEADAYFVNSGVPYTLLLASFYWDNFIFFGMGPQKDANGKLALNIPMGDKKLPGIAAEDIGKCALAIFKDPAGYQGKTVGIAGEHLTGQEMAASFSKAFNTDVAYNAVPFDVYRGLGFPGAEDLGNMFQFKHDFQKDFCGIRSVANTKAMNPELQSFDQWLDRHKGQINL